MSKQGSKPKAGRPLKLTEEVTVINTVGEIRTERRMTRGSYAVELIQRGAFKDDAAKLSGLGEATLHSYLATGRTDKAAGRVTVFSEFLESIEKAVAIANTEDLDFIRDAGFWQGRAWRLQHRDPGKFGQSQRIIVDSSARLEAAETAVSAFTDALQEHIADPALRLRILETALNALTPAGSAGQAPGERPAA